MQSLTVDYAFKDKEDSSSSVFIETQQMKAVYRDEDITNKKLRFKVEGSVMNAGDNDSQFRSIIKETRKLKDSTSTFCTVLFFTYMVLCGVIIVLQMFPKRKFWINNNYTYIFIVFSYFIWDFIFSSKLSIGRSTGKDHHLTLSIIILYERTPYPRQRRWYGIPSPFYRSKRCSQSRRSSKSWLASWIEKILPSASSSLEGKILKRSGSKSWQTINLSIFS